MSRAYSNGRKSKTPKRKHHSKRSRKQVGKPKPLRKQNKKKMQQLEFQRRSLECEYLRFDDIEKLRIIGAGGFGLVRIVKVLDQYMALKSVRKRFVEQNDCINEVIRERETLFMVRDCTFCTYLYRTFRTEKFVHFLMELYRGGDVSSYASSFKNYIVPEDTVKFIVACITEGLRFLRSKKYVLRDLKPENVLIDSKGYCCLADFGFSRQLKSGKMLHSIAGTEAYFSPELVEELPSDHGVDLWALGVSIFELLTGTLPFFQGPEDGPPKILQGMRSVKFPEFLSPAAYNIIRSLCRRNSNDRLGYESIVEVQKHKWFKGFNMRTVRSQTMKSPIELNLQGESDFGHFKPHTKRLQMHISPSDVNDGPPKNPLGWDAEF